MSNLTNHELNRHRKFMVTITETLQRTIEVDADDQYDAEQIVSDGWHSSKYILDADDFTGVEFVTAPVEESRQ